MIDLRRAVADTLEVLQLQAADQRDELERGGHGVRRRATALGQSAADATTDARARVAIDAQLAADPELSAMALEVESR